MPLSPAAEAARRPLPPEMLAVGEDEATHTMKGSGRSLRTSRSRGRGQSWERVQVRVPTKRATYVGLDNPG
jgi:hypothetical protein